MKKLILTAAILTAVNLLAESNTSTNPQPSYLEELMQGLQNLSAQKKNEYNKPQAPRSIGATNPSKEPSLYEKIDNALQNLGAEQKAEYKKEQQAQRSVEQAKESTQSTWEYLQQLWQNFKTMRKMIEPLQQQSPTR